MNMMQTKTRIAPYFRRSFTLVELLVAIAIIGVMTGMVLFSLAGAQRDALTARTRGTIGKINDVILQEWEKFRYRSVRIDVPSEWLRPWLRPTVNAANGILGQPPLSPREASRLRMIVLRDTMRMEMPDRINDILYPPALYVTAGNTANNPANPMDDESYTVTSRAVPGKFNNYRAKFNLVSFASPYINDASPAPNAVPVSASISLPSTQNESAECLYQIVSAANYQGGSALENFRPTEIGDTDGDGYLEFIDAWGGPISWIRWPAGFNSPLNDTTVDDPMDPLKVDWRHSKLPNYLPPNFTPKPWLLIPLVVSAGPDGIFDLKNPDTVIYATQTWGFQTDSVKHFSDPLISRNRYYFPDPYVDSYDPSGAWIGNGLGASIGPGDQDNITNYQLILE